MSLQAELEQILADKISCGERLDISMGRFCQYDELCINCTLILNDCTKAILATVSKHLPEKPSNELIQMSLQNGKPQQAASYNGYSAAITEMEKLLGGNNGK